MKRIIFALILLFSWPAFAEIHEAKYFYIDIPEGWAVQESENVIKITSSDNSGTLSITADKPEGKKIRELALNFSRELGGTEPESDEEGIFTFEFNNGESQAIIAGDEEFYMMITASGIENDGEILGQILESLEMK